MTIILTTIEQSLMFLPLVLGIYFSYKIIGTTDLTVDGSFVLGAAAFARLASTNIGPLGSCLLALFAGMLAGVGVALIQKGNKINSLIAGILALFILYSVNFQVLGRPNLSVSSDHTLIKLFNNTVISPELTVIILGCGICCMTLLILMNTKLGLAFRAHGDNPQLLQSLGYSPDFIKILGLGYSNGLAALCGILTAQINGFADLNMGFGMTLTGIGAVVIGCELIKKGRVSEKFCIKFDMLGCLLGTVIYFLALNYFLKIGIDPVHLKLVLGLLLIFFLRVSTTSHMLGKLS